MTAADDAIAEVVDKVVSGEAWREFCDLLAQAGDVILAEGNPDSPLDPGRGLPDAHPTRPRRAREPISSGPDPERPALICTVHETIKVVAENPDNLYLGARIQGDR